MQWRRVLHLKWKGECINVQTDKGVTAYREFCYRVTCPCGHEYRCGEFIRGEAIVCSVCNKAVNIIAIVYDNGCVTRIA